MIQRCSYWLDFIHYFVKNFEEKLKTYLGFWFVFGDLTKFHPLSFVRLYRLYRDYPELCVDVRFPWYCFVSTQSKQYQQPALAKTFLLFYTFVLLLLLSNRNNIKFGQKPPPCHPLPREFHTTFIYFTHSARPLTHSMIFVFTNFFYPKINWRFSSVMFFFRYSNEFFVFSFSFFSSWHCQTFFVLH